MEQPTRLFDLPAWQLAHYPQEDMMAAKEGGSWRTYATGEMIRLSRSLSAGLLRAGIRGNDLTPESQDKIAVISVNRPEWMIVDQACLQIGAALAPVYPTIHPDELEFILQDSEARIVFAGDRALYEKVQAMRDRVPSIRRIYTFDHVPGASHWTELCEGGLSAEEELEIARIGDSIAPHHLATIIYTSGTTGTPKGVMLSHHNILSNVLACRAYLPVSKDGRALSFLPLNHVYERMITYLYFYAGVSVYYAESMDSIGENLREACPDIFTTVPRLLEKVYEHILARGVELKGLKKKLFYWSIALGARYDLHAGFRPWYGLQLALARKLVFSKWCAALGGNVKAIVTGSAACQVRLLRIFTAAGINILEGYGLTETSPVISVNRMERADRMFGTVGPVIDGVEVKIAADGEILCKGPNVMRGYYRQPALTREVLEDGWFHTGDIGELVQGRFLKITDRKKEMFKTSGGKYVAPQPIENRMKESPFIEEIMVIGAERKFPAALIVPDFARLAEWCRHRGLPASSPAAMIRLPEVLALYKAEVNKYNAFFSHVEQVKKFELLEGSWTIDGGELTPTLKLKRKFILGKYAAALARIYG
jgi:long-chain acyl-CoA synthetase